MSERKVKLLKVRCLSAAEIAAMAPVDSLETVDNQAVYCEVSVIKQRLKRLAELHHLAPEKARKIIELLF
jgi:hypothetical protein